MNILNGFKIVVNIIYVLIKEFIGIKFIMMNKINFGLWLYFIFKSKIVIIFFFK